MGLKTIVREELKRRGLQWTRKAPQAQPNKTDAERLSKRQNGYQSLIASKHKQSDSFTMPGSYRK
jgi:hypothetical protein